MFCVSEQHTVCGFILEQLVEGMIQWLNHKNSHFLFPECALNEWKSKNANLALILQLNYIKSIKRGKEAQNLFHWLFH